MDLADAQGLEYGFTCRQHEWGPLPAQTSVTASLKTPSPAWLWETSSAASALSALVSGPPICPISGMCSRAQLTGYNLLAEKSESSATPITLSAR